MNGLDTWRYEDGRIEEVVIDGLQGNSWYNNAKKRHEIRILKTLSNEDAASVVVHEYGHYELTDKYSYLDEEVKVRVRTEKFRIRHNMPATKPGYRKRDSTTKQQVPNVEFIRNDVYGSNHYNPKGKVRIGRRYEPAPQMETTGWDCDLFLRGTKK